MPYKNPDSPEAKEAGKEASRRWYAKNRDKQMASQKKSRARKADWVKAQKTKCVRCGFDHPAALVFHHRDPSQKEVEITRTVALGWSKDRISSEIDKCDVLCANCHAIEHRG
jgi:hypothetical protein